MSNKIITKNSQTPGAVPDELGVGELAVNTGDSPPKLFVGHTGGLVIAVGGDYDQKADKTTSLVSGDTDMLVVTNPTFADDITITPRVNLANALVRLGPAGLVPPELLPPISGGALTFIGLWDASGGNNPPDRTESGDTYMVNVAGTLTLYRVQTQVPESINVEVGDFLVWIAAGNTTGAPEGWYYLGLASVPTLAEQVIVDDSNMPITTGDVQDALEIITTTYSVDGHTHDLGDIEVVTLNDSVDLDTLTDPSDVGRYAWASVLPINAPFAYGSMSILRDVSQNIQFVVGDTAGQIALRRANSGTYGAWTYFSNTEHVHSAAQITSGTLAIGRIPTGATASTVCIGDDPRLSDARAPTAHNHTTAQITSGVFDIARIPLGTTAATVCVGDDPRLSNARPPAAHTHATSEVTGLDTALAGKAPTSHTHTTAQVTGLDAALAGKAPTSHTHTTAQVTGLDTALAAKAPLASPALTGVPTAPTAAATVNNTQLATTAFAQTRIAQRVVHHATGAAAKAASAADGGYGLHAAPGGTGEGIGDTVVEAGENANGSYRIWSDGFIEQQGVSASGNTVNITFPIAYVGPAASITAGFTPFGTSTSEATISTKTITGLEMKGFGGGSANPKLWFARGF